MRLDDHSLLPQGLQRDRRLSVPRRVADLNHIAVSGKLSLSCGCAGAGARALW